MSTSSVRKFTISVDPDETLDFAENLAYFGEHLGRLGFTSVGTYTFRYTDQECMIKITLTESPDGYFVHAYVQAQDEHAYRVEEVADELGGYVLDPSKKAAL